MTYQYSGIVELSENLLSILNELQVAQCLYLHNKELASSAGMNF